ncbi:PREDICTED: insulin-like growth factor-binding protein complex acid labile subunit isoform X2 [Polistes dominula]|nr:PREDICTED: insulin-like growth factor-binding protein complex acid labile subunit isoform X2 [Polistes dominula]XP_015178511.1 PREDICTED: insulin-like growth factor-binding protein complex acid labile subunit isoform X2 [Polistes dominula]
MKIPAALLLTIVLCLSLFATRTGAALESNSSLPNELLRENHSTSSESSNESSNKNTTIAPNVIDKKIILPKYANKYTNWQDILFQQIHSLNEDENKGENNNKADNAFDYDEYNIEDDIDDDDDDDEDDEDNDEDANKNDENDDFGEIDDDDDDDDENVMTQCPDYCKCVAQYVAASTATCTKLVEGQVFAPGTASLRIENAEEIRLGPYALKSRGLQQLENLKIADTRIVDLDRTAFDGTPILFAINLTRNALEEIHPQTFKNNSQLSHLTISGNPLKYDQYFKGDRYYLFEAPSVSELVFSNNGLERLPRTAFHKMQNLEYINLSGNRLVEIEMSLFDTLSSLVDLDLSYNSLSIIPLELFRYSSLQVLRISGNDLFTLASIKGSELRTLEAAQNSIRSIGKEDLLGVPMLEQLIVNSNGMKRIHQHAFLHLEQLIHLDVSHNRLTSWTEHHLRNNPKLQILLMNNNPELKILPVFKTTGLKYETYSTYRFECSNCGLEVLDPQTFDEMPALNRLNLSSNRISSLPNGLFKFLTSLRELDISYNKINKLEENMFRGAVTLNRINLSGNPLKTLQVTPFLSVPSLAKLDVSQCELERVWSEARVPLQSLRLLSVRSNLLQRITLEELNATPKLSALDWSHNPLKCDEDFNKAIQWLTSHGITPVERRTYSTYGDNMDYSDDDGITQWKDLAKIICDSEEDGPPSRMIPNPVKPRINSQELIDDVENTNSLISGDREDIEEILKPFDHFTESNNDVERAWEQNQYTEYGDYIVESSSYRPWYSTALWPILTVIVVTLIVLLLIAHVAITVAKRRGRGRGPVIRPPMILRQSLVDNKNCGLVYKPLQEEIATPHMPKRGSFYSSSTFHYDKIVPESV